MFKLLAALTLQVVSCISWAAALAQAQPAALPFQHVVEVYRDEDADEVAFTLRLEQPFLADEFEKSNYLRLVSADERAYLIYPRQTRFQQKHAEFYGRLRGAGAVPLKLNYELVSENPDGTLKVTMHSADIQVDVPTAETGSRDIFQHWASEQNAHFAERLRFYPRDTFYQYCLLQARSRYGVAPDELPKPSLGRGEVESGLYEVFTGSAAIQESVQHAVLSGSLTAGDLTRHVSQIDPPRLRTLDYAKLLEDAQEKSSANGDDAAKPRQPHPHDVARLVPEDHYLLHFESMRAFNDLVDLTTDWGGNLLRMYTVHAQQHRLADKLEEQLILRRGELTRLFADQVVAEIALAGSDPFVAEGTDVTVLLKLKNAEVFDRVAAAWLTDAKRRHAGLTEREFNYRGQTVLARYTDDRLVSSFVVRLGDYAVYSNSHRAIRETIDVATGGASSLHDAADYRYLTMLLPPGSDEKSGYFFAPEAMLRRLVGPAHKISEKRRLQCYNNLVMLNNASLMYRMEYGRSPESLTQLSEKRFVDLSRVVCPHGGAYAFDPAGDTCTCSLHNRLRHLTPNTELTVLKTSEAEAAEYGRYKQRYEDFWRQFFDPIAVRITVDRTVRLESCVLPLASGSLYRSLRDAVGESPRPMDTAHIAPTAVASLALATGPKKAGEYLQLVPGVSDALKKDPTLTDLNWLGHRITLHFCDADSPIEIDPAKLRPLDLPFLGRLPPQTQAVWAGAFAATKAPVYVTVDVEDRAKAKRLLELVSQEAFLQQGQVLSLPAEMDAYRLSDYKQHPVYVLAGQLYAVRMRLYVALVDSQLVAATKPEILHAVIDAGGAPKEASPPDAHLMLRFNRRAVNQLRGGLRTYLAEKSRTACHANISSIHNLHKLYGVPMEDVGSLAEKKYGVSFICPDHGAYAYDAETDEVRCSVHGNRRHSQQIPHAGRPAAYEDLLDSIDEITVRLRFDEDALMATLEFVRPPVANK